MLSCINFHQTHLDILSVNGKYCLETGDFERNISFVITKRYLEQCRGVYGVSKTANYVSYASS